MITSVAMVFNYLRGLVQKEEAQDTFEYLLVIGGVSVAVIAAIVLASPGLINGVITAVCGAINTVIDPDIAC